MLILSTFFFLFSNYSNCLYIHISIYIRNLGNLLFWSWRTPLRKDNESRLLSQDFPYILLDLKRKHLCCKESVRIAHFEKFYDSNTIMCYWFYIQLDSVVGRWSLTWVAFGVGRLIGVLDSVDIFANQLFG